MDEQLVQVAIGRIQPNPQQPRQTFDEAKLIELAESIRAHGIIQPLVLAANGKDYTLIAGERRWRAAQIAGLETVPAVVRIADDRALRELALIENVQREDLTVHEEARAYQQLAEEHGLSDEEIGKRVGKARSTIANLRGLARLPDPVLQHVGSSPGQISQNVARELALAARYVQPKALADAAKQILEIEKDHSEGRFYGDDPEEIVEELLAEHSLSLPGARECWDLAWPGKPIAATDAEGPVEIRACKGCEHLIASKRLCTWERCYTAKYTLWATHELQRVSKKLGIPVPAAGEAVTVIEINWSNNDQCRRWAERPPKHLRLVARGLVGHSRAGDDSYHTAQILGSPAVRMATTDPGALSSSSARKTKAETIVPENESPASKAKREAAEEAERKAHRKERSAKRRAIADVDWLGVHTAEVLASQVQAFGGTLAWMLAYVENDAHAGNWPAVNDALGANEEARKKTKGKDLEGLQREAILMNHLSEMLVTTYEYPPDKWHFDFSGALKTVKQMAEEMGMTLPKGWDEPPIHRTEANCHVCGTFAPNDKITKRDIEEDGWDIRYQDEANKRSPIVTCSDKCRAKLPKIYKPAPKKARK